MRLHRGLAEAVIGGLVEIFQEGRQADKVVDMLLKSNKKWGKRDRSFIAEHLYEMVRWWQLVRFTADIEEPKGKAAFWKLFQAWLAIKSKHLGVESNFELPDWPEFDASLLDLFDLRYQKAQTIRGVIHSIPEWLDKVGVAELQEKWVAELQAQNKQAPLYLRVNSLKATVSQVQDIFGADQAGTVAGVASALRLVKREQVANRDSFKMGYFEVQDAGSQQIAPFLNPQPGELVVDACAGAGGKTLHLAALMGNRGQLFAMDTDPAKLYELQRRAKRAGVGIIRTLNLDKVDELRDKADRLLLDVPCSGLGVLRRHPDSKWKLTPEFMQQVKQSQRVILRDYSQMVKIGGTMVYATCSILPSESEDQIRGFLHDTGDKWKLASEYRTNPAVDDCDGFYMAALIRQM